MGRSPEEARREDTIPPGLGTGDRDPADAAFEALRAAAHPEPRAMSPLADAEFESLLAHLKGLGSREAQVASSKSSVEGQNRSCESRVGSRESLVEGQEKRGGGHDRVARTVILRAAGELGRLHRMLAQAGTDAGTIWPRALDELARLSVNLQVHSMRTEPGAVLVTEAGGWRFALPLTGIEEVRPADERPAGLAALDPRAWWDGRGEEATAGARYWIVAVAGAQRAALAVGALHGVCVVQASPPGPMLAGARSIAGIVRDAGGCPVVLVRLEEILAPGNRSEG